MTDFKQQKTQRVINSYTFVQKAKTWEIYQDKVQVSYHAVNSYSLVTIDKAINLLIDTLNNDKEHFKERIKLTLTDIPKLTELFLSESYFLDKKNIHLLQNS